MVYNLGSRGARFLVGGLPLPLFTYIINVISENQTKYMKKRRGEIKKNCVYFIQKRGIYNILNRKGFFKERTRELFALFYFKKACSSKKRPRRPKRRKGGRGNVDRFFLVSPNQIKGKGTVLNMRPKG